MTVATPFSGNYALMRRRRTAIARVAIDWNDLGLAPAQCSFVRTDREGNRTSLTREQLESPMTFAPDTCFGIEISRL